MSNKATVTGKKTKQPTYPPPPQPPPALPPLDYRELSWWPESADGMRDKDLVVALIGGKYVIKDEKLAIEAKDHIVLRGIHVSPICSKREPVDKMLVQVGDEIKECKSEMGKCDAVFASESAIEKFLIPYYHSHRLFTKTDWDKLNKALGDETVLAIAHVAPSHSFAVYGKRPIEEELAVAKKPALGISSVDWMSLGDYLSL
jgi:hypothetical protein